MRVYLDLLVLVNGLVDFFLLLGANRLTGYGTGVRRCALGATIGGLYGGLCVVPAFAFLGGFIWRMIMLSIISCVAFGFHRSAVRRGVLFVVLSMALGGITLGMGQNGFMALVMCAAVLAGLCIVGFRDNASGQKIVPVSLHYRGRKYQLLALQDTGNSLHDAVTGCPVLVVGPEIAWDVLGLTAAQLADPVGTMARQSDLYLRLISYRAVGQSAGMLLAMRFDKIMINGEERNQIVAFAPNSIGQHGKYQALAGGM